MVGVDFLRVPPPHFEGCRLICVSAGYHSLVGLTGSLVNPLTNKVLSHRGPLNIALSRYRHVITDERCDKFLWKLGDPCWHSSLTHPPLKVSSYGCNPDSKTGIIDHPT